MPKTILFLNHNFKDQGTWFRNFYLAKGLTELGYKCELWTTSPVPWFKTKNHLLNGVRVVEFPQITPFKKLGCSGLCPWDILNRSVAALRLKSKWDVIFASEHFPNVFFLNVTLSKGRTKVIADWADLFTDGGIHESWNVGFKKILYKMENHMEFSIKKRANFCTATSRYLHNKLKKDINICPTRCGYLPSGCRSDEIKYSLPQNKDHLTIGISSGQGKLSRFEINEIDSLIDANRNINGKPITLLLVGPFPESIRLEFKCQISIQITGRLSPNDSIEALRDCDGFMLCEEPSPYYKSRGPIRLNDYLCLGRPIFLNPTTDLYDLIIKNHAGIHWASSQNEMSAIKVFNDQKSRLEIGMNARRLSENKLSWKYQSMKLEEIIQLILINEQI